MPSTPTTYPYQRNLNRFALVLMLVTFLLIMAGALVTSNDAGLAVPDWPTSFGSLIKIPPMVGGVKYEHGHRMVAQFAGLLTIVLAVWAQWREPRLWMRRLGWGLLALVIVQGIFGGLTVLYQLPWYLSTTHAMLAQTFFSFTCLFYIFGKRSWMENESAGLPDTAGITMRQLSLAAIAVTYLQLFLGAAFRHGGMPFYPHILGAVAATAVLLWASVRAMTVYPHIKGIKASAVGILTLLLVQLGLGFGAYLTRVEWGQDAPQPLPLMVWSTVAHVGVGAVLLAHCFMLAAYSFSETVPATQTAAEEPDEMVAV